MSCDLLHDQDIAQVVHAGSAVLFGNADAQESQLAAHLDFVHREGMCLVEFTDGLGDGIVGEIFGQCLDCQLIFCQKVFVFHVILLAFHGFNVFCTYVGIGCFRVLGVWVIDDGCRVLKRAWESFSQVLFPDFILSMPRGRVFVRFSQAKSEVFVIF